MLPIYGAPEVKKLSQLAFLLVGHKHMKLRNSLMR
jgi:hypothetical protein